MKSQITFLVGIIAVAISCPVFAQDSGATNGIVAVLDVAEVFKDNGTFDQSMKNIKAQAEKLKVEIQGQQENCLLYTSPSPRDS